MNPLDMLGAVMQSGLSKTAADRMGAVLGEMVGRMAGGGGAAAGAATGAGQGGAGGGLLDQLAQAAGAMLGGAPAGAGQAVPAGAPGGGMGDLLGQLAGAVLGGSGGQGNAGAGLGSMAVFGTLAAKALELAKGMMGGPAAAGGAPGFGMDDLSAVLAGLRPPANPQQQQQLMDVATLTLKAMITAAKADGRIDDQERERLLGRLNEGGISPDEQRFVNEEMQKPIDIDALVRAVPNEQVAAQVYTASLMAITVDTEPEQRYMADLAAKLRLDPRVVANLHRAVGLA